VNHITASAAAIELQLKLGISVRYSREINSGVSEFFYNHPEGLDPPDHNACCGHVRGCQRFTTLKAKAGDVILLHGLLPHTNSVNYRNYARVITNPHATLRKPYDLDRSDGEYVSDRGVVPLLWRALPSSSLVPSSFS
jgi:hypothetical protein